jgi:hypothetical protein
MKKDEALELIKLGKFDEWNSYRKNNNDWQPDLSNLDISKYDLRTHNGRYTISQFNLKGADLRGTTLPEIPKFPSEYADNDYTGDWHDKSYDTFLKDCLVDIFTKHPGNYVPVQLGAKFTSATDSAKSNSAGAAITAFISYAWANEELVRAIDKWLRLKGVATKLDKRDFFAGSRIRDEIVRVMSECESIIIFHSNESQDKPWILFERELAADLEMEAKQTGRNPPRIIYFVVDGSPLPGILEKHRIAILAKGKTFTDACEELYRALRQISADLPDVDLERWSKHIF